jgi:hypothetical protein
MIRKRKIAIVVAGVFLLAGISFGISNTNRDGLRSDIFWGGSSRFICTAKVVAPRSRETRDYNDNISERNWLIRKQSKLQADTNVLNKTCNKLKGKNQTQCQKDVAELSVISRRLEILKKSIVNYETCKNSFNTTTAPKCGSAINTTFSIAPTDYLCVSGVLSDPVGFDPTIRGTNGNGTWEWSCGDGSLG